MAKDIAISKHRKCGKTVGFKKFVHGRNFHLVTGTDGHAERQAKAIARALVAKAELLKMSAQSWTDEIVKECYDLGNSHSGNLPALPRDTQPAAAAPSGQVMAAHDEIWLYPLIKKYQLHEKDRYVSGEIGERHYSSGIDRIDAARRIIEDQPMSQFDLAALDKWVREWRARPISEYTGAKISPERVVALVGAIRHLLKFAKRYGHWQPPLDWLEIFRGITVKKLCTPLERKEKAKEPLNFTLLELQILWHFAVPDQKVILTLACFAGHTQTEMATALHDDFVETENGLYLDRFRNKTGIHGRWWIPPEGAGYVRHWLARTPLDPDMNPNQLAFLTRRGLPLVHRSRHKETQWCDNPGTSWTKLTTVAEPYGVRPISLKYARKTFSQLVRNELGEEFSILFCAQQHDTVQSEFYTRASMVRLEKCMREVIYPVWRKLFEPIDLKAVLDDLKRTKASAPDKAA
jgi:hypothetical protein